MDEAIKNTCYALKGEAKAVISYVEKISSTPVNADTEEIVRTFVSNMLDNVSHIQSLTLKLSESIGSVIPATVMSSEEDV